MDFASVDAYLQQLNNTQVYTDLDQETKEKAVFSAIEALKDVYRESLLNDRIAAIQTLYMLEGDDEEYAKLKRHGVSSFSTKGVSVSFDSGNGSGGSISPEVVSIINKKINPGFARFC